MEKPKKTQQKKHIDNGTKESDLKPKEEPQKNNNGLVNNIFSEIQSIFRKKDTLQKEQHENEQLEKNNTQISEDKRFLGEIELTDQNILNISLYKKTKQNQNDSNPIEKMLRNISANQALPKPTKENLIERVTVTLDGKKLEQSRYAIKSDDIISVVLENSSDVNYQITATADDDYNDNN